MKIVRPRRIGTRDDHRINDNRDRYCDHQHNQHSE
jgi:hypothetical protein